MDEKGGMDDDEFVPLYPNAKNKPGQRVIIKVDSGPERTNLKLLAKLRMLGCDTGDGPVLGPFKTQFLIKLDLIVEDQINKKKSLSLQPKFAGLPLFGGTEWNQEHFKRGSQKGDACPLGRRLVQLLKRKSPMNA
jgi:hypothetical protein